MERYIVFLDWENQYCQSKYTTQGNLQIQCNPYQINNNIFLKNKNKIFTICMETQKTLNSQSNLEKEKQNGRKRAPWLQNIIQGYSNQKSVILTQKQKYRSMKQERNKPTNLWLINQWQKRQEYTIEKRHSLQ